MGNQYFMVQMKDKDVVHFQRIQEWGKQTESAAQAFSRRMLAYDYRINNFLVSLNGSVTPGVRGRYGQTLSL